MQSTSNNKSFYDGKPLLSLPFSPILTYVYVTFYP